MVASREKQLQYANIEKEASVVSVYVELGYRLIAIIFLASSLFTFFVSLVHPFGIDVVISFLYVVLDGILIYGFWKMRRWVVVLISVATVFLMVNNFSRVLLGTQKIKLALLINILFFGSFSFFSYFTRGCLNGKYLNVRVVRAFVVVLILVQILFIFKRL